MMNARFFTFTFFSLASLLPSIAVAFLCGVGELPVGISVHPDGQPLLLCQRSQCLVQSDDLGYTKMACGDQLISSCLRENAFIISLACPEKSSPELALLCCNHPSLTLRNTTTEQIVGPNSTIIVGGSVTSPSDAHEIGFNLIKNIVKIIDENDTISYRVIIDRADCQIPTSPRILTENAVRTKLQELHRKQSRPKWHDPPIVSLFSHFGLQNILAIPSGARSNNIRSTTQTTR